MGQLPSTCLPGSLECDRAPAAEYTEELGHGLEPVRLNIYDAATDARVELVNGLFRQAGAGLYHAGVEVYGSEWSFGSRSGSGTGVFSCEPRSNDAVGKFREAVMLGGTRLSSGGVSDCLVQLSQEWIGADYDLMSRNCCHFCSSFLALLGAGGMPRWVTSLAGTGEALRSSAQAVHKAAWSSAPTLVGGMQAGLETVSSLLTSVDVVLEVVRGPGGAVDVAGLRRSDRGFAVRLAPGRPERIGPAQQPDAFARILGQGAADVLEAALPEGFLFQLEWAPPCLFLRKPSDDAHIKVGSSVVRQPTFVLLNGSEIAAGLSADGEALLVLKVDRSTSSFGLTLDRTLSSLALPSTRSSPL